MDANIAVIKRKINSTSIQDMEKKVNKNSKAVFTLPAIMCGPMITLLLVVAPESRFSFA